MQVVNSGSNDKAVIDADKSRKEEFFTDKDILRAILRELAVLNAHQEIATGLKLNSNEKDQLLKAIL